MVNTKEEVFQLIKEERNYQDSKFPDGRPLEDDNTSIASWILYMEFHLNKAKENVYRLNDKEAMASVRKLTGLGFACMEFNETPKRILN